MSRTGQEMLVGAHEVPIILVAAAVRPLDFELYAMLTLSSYTYRARRSTATRYAVY